MPKNRTIEGWLESITNPKEEVSKNDLKKRVYKSLMRNSVGKRLPKGKSVLEMSYKSDVSALDYLKVSE